MAYPSLVFPPNSLSWEKEKVSFFRRSQRLLHGGRGDSRPQPSLIPFSFPFFSVFFFYIASFFFNFRLSLFSTYFCLSAAFVQERLEMHVWYFLYIYIFFFFLSQKCFFHFLSGFVVLFVEKAFLGWSAAYQSFSALFLLFPFLLVSCFVFVFAVFLFFVPSPYVCQLPTIGLRYRTVFCSVERVIDSPVYQVGRSRALFFLLAL